MPHRIALDIRMINNTGIGTYLRGLLGGLQNTGLRKDLDLLLCGRKVSPAGIFVPDVPFMAPIYSIQEQLAYPAMLRNCRLWHAPHYNIPFFKGPAKLVVTIHDIIHWVFRKQLLSPLQTVYAGSMLKRAVTLADHIIAVSEHTKKDLVEQFKADAKKITVVYEGVGGACREMAPAELKPAFETLRAKYNVPENYFLYVGLLKPHKNVQWLLRLFRTLRAGGRIRSPLVVIGRKDKKYPEGYEELEDLTSDADVIHLPRIEHEELIAFYNQALALIHPSLYEGFGLTLLEAMACGTPVIATNASSIPEVVGDAAVRVDTDDESPMMDAVVRMENDAELRESYRVQGLERVKRFSWDETARKTAAVYEKVLAGGL